jgi:hypothetical protein
LSLNWDGSGDIWCCFGDWMGICGVVCDARWLVDRRWEVMRGSGMYGLDVLFVLYVGNWARKVVFFAGKKVMRLVEETG